MTNWSPSPYAKKGLKMARGDSTNVHVENLWYMMINPEKKSILGPWDIIFSDKTTFSPAKKNITLFNITWNSGEIWSNVPGPLKCCSLLSTSKTGIWIRPNKWKQGLWYPDLIWLMVLTILKNMKVNGKDDIPDMKWKINNVWNHQLINQLITRGYHLVPYPK